MTTGDMLLGSACFILVLGYFIWGAIRLNLQAEGWL